MDERDRAGVLANLARWDEAASLHADSDLYDLAGFALAATTSARSSSTRSALWRGASCSTCNVISGPTRCRGHAMAPESPG